MRVSGGFSNSGINNLFNTLHQGKVAMHANRLSNSLFQMPKNNAPGSGSGSVNADTVRYVSSLRTSADSLASALRGLTGSGSGTRIVAISSNPGVVSIQHTGTRPNAVSSMEVRIDQIAASQANEGNRMTADAAFEGRTGTNQFSIQMGNSTTNLSVNVREGDTNREVQQRMADAINNSNAGVRASVTFDAETNTSMLRLEGNTTGTDPRNAFTVSDVGSGSLVAQTGANEVARQGQDAIFSVNGGPERRSQSNTVFIGNGVTATFNAASEDAVRISWGQETNNNVSRSAVEGMVRSFNDLFNTAAGRIGDQRSQQLASSMVNISSAFSSSLSEIGIGFDSSGRMTINQQRMDQAAESGALGRFFNDNSGRNSFASQLGRLADNVARNPSSFVSSPLFGSNLTGNFGYSSFGNPTQFNPFGSGSVADFMF